RNDSKRDKRSAWEDLLKVMERCGLPISDRQRGYFL
ncbi:MAG TPA: uracil-DNA glycosylase, partial [Opitutae bacterium]|nr:uracil-DNA glycosylase [Opitutae bacterium]